MVLRVGALSDGVVAPFHQVLLKYIRGCISLPLGVGKRDQGVGAPFHWVLENE